MLRTKTLPPVDLFLVGFRLGILVRETSSLWQRLLLYFRNNLLFILLHYLHYFRLSFRLLLLFWRDIWLNCMLIFGGEALSIDISHQILDIDRFLIGIFLLFGASSLPILLDETLHFLHKFSLLRGRVLVEPLPHPLHKRPLIINDLPLGGVLDNVAPLVYILHGEENGFLDIIVVLLGFGGEQQEQLLYGRFGVVFVLDEDLGESSV